MLINKGRHNTTKLRPNAVQELKINQRRILIDSLEIGIPAPKQMIALGERQLPNGVKVGQLLNSKTLNYKKFTPHRDGLFCERIFGPVQSFVCACGKKKESVQGKNRQKEIVNKQMLTSTSIMGEGEGTDQLQKQALFCPKCQVEYVTKDVRRHRLGYIKLFAPVTHIWYLKGRPSYLSLFLGKRKKAMTSLAYCNAFLVEQVYSDLKLETQNVPKNVEKSTTDLLEKNNLKKVKKYHVNNLNKKQALYKFCKNEALDACTSKAVGPSSVQKKQSKYNENQAFFAKALVAPDWFQTQKTLTNQIIFSKRNCEKKPCKSSAFASLCVQNFVLHNSVFALCTSEACACKTSFCKPRSFFSLLVKLFPETCIQGDVFTNPSLNSIKGQSFDKDKQKIKQCNKSRAYNNNNEVGQCTSKACACKNGVMQKRSLLHACKTSFCKPRFLTDPNITKHNRQKSDLVQNNAAFTGTCYIRAQTLPFLPSLISPFHLRDCLISFLQSTPCREDVPIPLYCQTPRRYPLRDVHKFITEFRSQEGTKKTERLTSDSIVRLTSTSKHGKPSIRSYFKFFSKRKARENEIKNACTKTEPWFANVLDAQALACKNGVFATPLTKMNTGRAKTKFLQRLAKAKLLHGFLHVPVRSHRVLNNNFKLCIVLPFGLINTFTRFKVITFALPGITLFFNKSSTIREKNKSILSSTTNKEKAKFTFFYSSAKAEREAVNVLPFLFKYQYKGDSDYTNKRGNAQVSCAKQHEPEPCKNTVMQNEVLHAKALQKRTGVTKRSFACVQKRSLLLNPVFASTSKACAKYKNNVFVSGRAFCVRALHKRKFVHANAFAQLRFCKPKFLQAAGLNFVRSRSLKFFKQNKALSNLLFDVQPKNSKKTWNGCFGEYRVDYQSNTQSLYTTLFSNNLLSFSIKKETQTYQARLLYMVFGAVNQNINLNQLTQPRFNSFFKSSKKQPFLNNRCTSLHPTVFLLEDSVDITNREKKVDKTEVLAFSNKKNVCLVQAKQTFDPGFALCKSGGYKNGVFVRTSEARATLAKANAFAQLRFARTSFACAKYKNEAGLFVSGLQKRSFCTAFCTAPVLFGTTQQQRVVTLSSRPFSSFIRALKLGNILTVSFSISLPFFISGSKQNIVFFITKKERKTEWKMKKTGSRLLEFFLTQAQTKPNFFMFVNKQHKVLSKAELCLTHQYLNSFWKKVTDDTFLRLPFGKKSVFFSSNAPEPIIKETDQLFLTFLSNKARSFKKSSDFISNSFPDLNVFTCILVKNFTTSEQRTLNHHNLTKSIKVYNTCVNKVQRKQSDNINQQKGPALIKTKISPLAKSPASFLYFAQPPVCARTGSVTGMRNFIKSGFDLPFTKMWLEQKHASFLATHSYLMVLKEPVLNKASLYSSAKTLKVKYDQVKTFTDTDKALSKDSQTSFGSEMISKWHLNGAREILLYTGGGALESLLKRFNISLFYEFLFGEIQILRKYYKNQLFIIADHNTNKTLKKQDYAKDPAVCQKPCKSFAFASQLQKHRFARTSFACAKYVQKRSFCTAFDNPIQALNLSKQRISSRFGPENNSTSFRGGEKNVPQLRATNDMQVVSQSSVFNVYKRRSYFVNAAIKAEIPKSFDVGEIKKQIGFPDESFFKKPGVTKTPFLYAGAFAPVTRKEPINTKALACKNLSITEKNTNSYCRRIYRTTRRLKIVQLLMRSQRRPEWMLISILPVLPPDLRPVLQMGENLIVASDLNTLYQRVIYRNNRHYKGRFLDFHFVSSIHRLVQDAVDRLIENGKGGSTPFLTPGGRPLKSLSDILKGKRGRFRFNLLGKRVDFSGRSVIVVSPNLKIHECGLPREMALELYKYLLIRQLLLKKRVSSIVNAKKVIKQRKPFIWDMLREIIYYHPLLLNRAPTLHRLGIQAFQPKLTIGNAILLHPLVCAGFNADFDGDQMGVHLPLSPQARAEAWDLLWSRNNLLSPATGQPILLPSQDMVLGFYYMTALLPSGTKFKHRDEEQQLNPERMITNRGVAKTVFLRAQAKLVQSAKTQFLQRPYKNSVLARQGFDKISRFLNKNSNTAINKNKIPTYVFSDTAQIVHAYQKKQIDIHTPIWLKWAGKSENGEKYQTPLELRLDMFGYRTQIYPTYKYKSQMYKDKNTSFFTFNKNNTVTIHIRTTVGRVLVNNLINRH